MQLESLSPLKRQREVKSILLSVCCVRSEKLDLSNLLTLIVVQLMFVVFSPENTILNWKVVWCRKKVLKKEDSL